MKLYKDNCMGCRISRGQEPRRGGIIELAGNWILSHYEGSEGFLGWMALQPKSHKMGLADLDPEQVRFFGKHVQDVDAALCRYWSTRFRSDPIQRVYIAYFFESVFDEAKSEEYHLHIHLIPRTERVGSLLRECGGIVAWRIPYVTQHRRFPTEYLTRDGGRRINTKEVLQLVGFLRSRLRGGEIGRVR